MAVRGRGRRNGIEQLRLAGTKEEDPFGAAGTLLPFVRKKSEVGKESLDYLLLWG